MTDLETLVSLISEGMIYVQGLDLAISMADTSATVTEGTEYNPADGVAFKDIMIMITFICNIFSFALSS